MALPLSVLIKMTLKPKDNKFESEPFGNFVTRFMFVQNCDLQFKMQREQESTDTGLFCQLKSLLRWYGERGGENDSKWLTHM